MSCKARIVHLILFTLLSGLLLFGQAGDTGAILGTVTDASGAVVCNANVTVNNLATGAVKQAKTSSSGDFTVPYLQPGTYTVTIEAPGFQKSVLQNVTLAVAQETRLNFALKPGAVSETVSVEANTVTLDTDSPTISTVISQKQVEELPLNGRNFVQLLLLGQGAVTIGGEQGTMRQGQGNAISINGGRPTSDNYTLDGLVNTDPSLNTPALILAQDSIQ